MSDKPSPGDWLSDAELTDMLKPGIGEEPHDYLRTPRSEREILPLTAMDWKDIACISLVVLAIIGLVLWAIWRKT